MSAQHKRLQTLYEAFNARNIELALSGMHPDVDWANGMEGGIVHGRSGVRDYWTRQWQLIDPRDYPQSFEGDSAEIVAEVHQVVRDLEGKIKSDQSVRHFFLFEDELVKVFKILYLMTGSGPDVRGGQSPSNFEIRVGANACVAGFICIFIVFIIGDKLVFQ